jgi:hypothetical protein
MWVATQTDDDFVQITFRGQLNRGDIANTIGCGKSALRQNGYEKIGCVLT